MPQAQATVPTEHAERYRLQLCKHFAHKVEVRDENGTGEIAFSCGVARVVSEAGQLSISVTSPTEQELTETKDVVERHLLRFAFREELGPLVWS